MVKGCTPDKAVIQGACDFLALSGSLHIRLAKLQAPHQNRHPACPGVPWERSASQIYRKQSALWRGVEEPVLSVAEGTPAMLLGRCSWELSGRELQTARPMRSHGARLSRVMFI